MDLALNNLERLIYQSTNQPKNQSKETTSVDRHDTYVRYRTAMFYMITILYYLVKKIYNLKDYHGTSIATFQVHLKKIMTFGDLFGLPRG